jgi:hypothetical protein
MGHTVADRSSNKADFLCLLLYLAWLLCKSVVALVFTVSTISGRVFQHLRLPVFHWYRPSLPASRWDIRLLIGRRTKPTFCVVSLLNVAFMQKCSDACGYGEYYFRSVFSASLGAGIYEALDSVDGKSMGHTVADRSSNKADFLCIFCI